MLTPDYVVGLVDGEGSFTIYVKNPNHLKTRVRRVNVEPRFYVKLVAKDRCVLEDLKRFFRCGRVYSQVDKRRNHQDCFRFEVFNRKDLRNIIIPFFLENELRFPSKIRDFKIFCRITEAMDRGEHLKEGGLRRIYRLKSKMH